MTTRPGCESSCPHPAAGAQSSRAGREAAGGDQTPCACVPRNRVTSAGLGRTELVATLLTPQLQATQGRSPGKLCKQLLWLSQVRPAHGHPACGGQAPRPPSCGGLEEPWGQLRRRAVEAETTRKALAGETGSCPCSAQRDLLPLQLRKEQGSRALLAGESQLSSHCRRFCSKRLPQGSSPF